MMARTPYWPIRPGVKRSIRVLVVVPTHIFSHLSPTLRRLGAVWYRAPFKAHWRRVIVVKNVDLGQVPDAEQRAVEVDGVPGVQTADDLFGKRRREVMYLAHLLFLPLLVAVGHVARRA